LVNVWLRFGVFAEMTLRVAGFFELYFEGRLLILQVAVDLISKFLKYDIIFNSLVRSGFVLPNWSALAY
jgi:hypothetical protein